MISKELFCRIMKELELSNQLENDIANLLQEYENKLPARLGLSDCYGIGLSHQDLIVELLKEIFNDYETDKWLSNIEYFIYELDFGKNYENGLVVDKDGNEIDFSTSENLYDYLVSIKAKEKESKTKEIKENKNEKEIHKAISKIIEVFKLYQDINGKLDSMIDKIDKTPN